MIKCELTPGERLKDYLEENGITRRSLSNAANVSESVITDFCNDKRTITSANLAAICKQLNLSSDYLLGLSETKVRDADITSVSDYLGLTGEAIEHLKYLCEEGAESYRFIDYLLSNRESFFAVEALLTTIINSYHFYVEYKKKSEIARKLADSIDDLTPVLMIEDSYDFADYRNIKAFLRLREFVEPFYQKYYEQNDKEGENK